MTRFSPGARGTSAVNWPSGPTVRVRAICPVVTFRTDRSSTLAIDVRGRMSTMSARVSTRWWRPPVIRAISVQAAGFPSASGPRQKV